MTARPSPRDAPSSPRCAPSPGSTGEPDYERLFAIGDRSQRGSFGRYRATTSRPLAVVRLLPT